MEGYLSTGPNQSFLFATKEDADYCSHQNAIHVRFGNKVELIPDNPKHTIDKFDHQRVFLFGKFNAKSRELVDVERVATVKRFYDGGRIIQPEPGRRGRGSLLNQQ